MYKDSKEIIELILSGNSSIWIILTLIIILWIFKEIRVRYLKDMDFETARMDEVLKVYGMLEIKIKKHLDKDNKESEDSLLESISTSYSYLSRPLFKECEAYYIHINRDKTEKLLVILRKEISSLNYEQSKRIDFEKKEIIAYFERILKPFLIPGIITFITLLLTLLAILFGMGMINSNINWYDKIWIATECGSAYLIMLLVYVLVSMVFDRKFENNTKNWIYISLIIASFISTLIIQYLSIIYFCFLVYFVFFRFPKMKRI